MHFPFSPDGPTSPAASGPTPPLPGSVQAHRGPVTSTHRPLEIAEVNRCSFSLPFSLPILNPRAYRRWQLGGGLRQGHIGVGARVSYVQWRHGYGHTGRCELSSQRKLQGAGGHEHSHKVFGSMGSRYGVAVRGTLLVIYFYTSGRK
jgi:hypothetical protein